MSPPLLDQLDDLIARTRRRLALRKLVLGGAVGLSGLLTAQLYGVTPRDPRVLGTVSAVLLAVGACAPPESR